MYAIANSKMPDIKWRYRRRQNVKIDIKVGDTTKDDILFEVQNDKSVEEIPFSSKW